MLGQSDYQAFIVWAIAIIGVVMTFRCTRRNRK